MDMQDDGIHDMREQRNSSLPFSEEEKIAGPSLHPDCPAWMNGWTVNYIYMEMA